ncbi:lytic transglycosylase domain-containing protein [Polynucleobacter sp. 86C-FISCH]|uniref:lytic transglycosylase domain-containing protein n=1 Tax=Polynucleobacter sp. 86C-FISCH TaxID=2689101 RepID=UPI001C0C9489|nr:lytic transglycosylase domain-containing protein [Polynucleobacter sp. 86C-FISCH]MBU3595087.1 lytic transglycosylase domain-containing protein [Polynucleobacter sp. 86C-FISCH]
MKQITLFARAAILAIILVATVPIGSSVVHAQTSGIEGLVRCLQSDSRFRGNGCNQIVGRYWAIEPLITQAALQEKMEPALLKALVAVESAYNPQALSRAGARGLTQVIPSTAMSLGQHPDNLWDSRQSLATGAHYLAAQWYTFKNWPLAIAAYNAGPGAVRKYGGIPPYPETQAYVNNVLYVYRRFREYEK